MPSNAGTPILHKEVCIPVRALKRTILCGVVCVHCKRSWTRLNAVMSDWVSSCELKAGSIPYCRRQLEQLGERPLFSCIQCCAVQHLGQLTFSTTAASQPRQSLSISKAYWQKLAAIEPRAAERAENNSGSTGGPEQMFEIGGLTSCCVVVLLIF